MPGTVAFDESFSTMLIEPGVTGSEKVAATGEPIATPLAPSVGDFTLTLGGVVSLAVAEKTTSTQ